LKNKKAVLESLNDKYFEKKWEMTKSLFVFASVFEFLKKLADD
jgi:hypothetical protein